MSVPPRPQSPGLPRPLRLWLGMGRMGWGQRRACGDALGVYRSIKSPVTSGVIFVASEVCKGFLQPWVSEIPNKNKDKTDRAVLLYWALGTPNWGMDRESNMMVALWEPLTSLPLLPFHSFPRPLFLSHSALLTIPTHTPPAGYVPTGWNDPSSLTEMPPVWALIKCSSSRKSSSMTRSNSSFLLPQTIFCLQQKQELVIRLLIEQILWDRNSYKQFLNFI